MSDFGKIGMGEPWKITFGSTVIGVTEVDSLEINVDKQIRDVFCDEFGANPVGENFLGHMIEVSFAIKEEVQENLAIALAEAYDGGSYIFLGRRPGYDLADSAAALLLHPIAQGATTTRDITLYKAVCISMDAIPLHQGSERIYAVTFRALVDATKTDRDYLGEWWMPAR